MLSRPLTRRRFTTRVLRALAWLPLAGLVPRARATSTSADTRFIARALELARHGRGRGDGTGYGALVVRDGEVIAEAWNRAYLKHDATAHAEVEVIQAACRVLGTRDLAGCTLYTNGGRPCPMCEGAAYFAGIERLVHAPTVDAITDLGRPTLGGCG